ncbi:MAG: beta-ketoacyl-ACP synthase III [Hyphomonadaceae bacterium]
MSRPVISATGLYTPPHSISNAELVASFNAWVDKWNTEHAADIEAGRVPAKSHSSVEFIEKASGIKARYVVDKAGVLDINRMVPNIPERPNEQVSILAEIAVTAAKEALAKAGKEGKQVDAVICAASNMQRAYPAMAIEVQDAIGSPGFAFDMNVACSSATFGIQTGADFVRAGHAKTVLMVNPEICSGHLNFTDRDSHFIFGDVATAVLIEAEEVAPKDHWNILGTHLKTQFSNNIRNNFGFLNRGDPEGVGKTDKLFVQEGRKVFKEVVPMVSQMILGEMDRLGIGASELRRMWLHQANAGMNRLIAERVLGHEASEDESPTVLDTYANTSSAGSIIAFHKHSADFKPGEKGLICSFGAGYSAGTVFVEKTG